MDMFPVDGEHIDIASIHYWLYLYLSYNLRIGIIKELDTYIVTFLLNNDRTFYDKTL